MRRAVSLFLLSLLTISASAQSCQTGWSSVQASKIIDLSGSLLASGTLSITGVDANRNIINFGAPGGGAVMRVAKKAPVSNGAIVGTVCVPRSDKATVYVRYHIVVTDNSASGTHAVVIDANDIPITADVFSLDAYPFPADAYANPPNEFSSGHVDGDLTVTGTIYAGTIEGATAANADHATTADSATTADTATTATSANHASMADTATLATNAGHATSADSATTASTASALAATPTDCGTEAINGINADGSPKSCIDVSSSGGNPSVGDQGTLQTAGAIPGTFGAATPNQVNAALGSSNGLDLFADSIGQATGATSTGPGNAYLQQGYAFLWQQAIGGPFLLGGTSGDQEADVNYKWVYRVSNPQGNGSDPLSVEEVGTNDAIHYLGDTDKQHIFQRLKLGSMAWRAIPRANKIFAQNCTLAGGMAADPSPLQAGLGVKATTNGATASCVVNAPKANDAIYACYLIQDANTGTFNLSLDGTPQTDPFNGTTTWNAFGDNGAAIQTQNLVTAGVACARFTGVSSGNHTMLFTVTSATGATAAVWPQWVGAAPASSTLNPYIVEVSPNQQNTGSAGAPYVSTFQVIIQTLVADLTADGLNSSYSNTSDALLNDPGCGNGNQALMFSLCYADNVHPDNAGHAVMAKTGIASTPSSFLLAVSHWNPKQPGQNYPTSLPVSPYRWFDVNNYNLPPSATACTPGVKLQGGNGQFFGITTCLTTGMTFLAPSGVQGFTFCPFGGGGFMGALPPALSSCMFAIKTNGLIDFNGGSTLPNGISIQGGQFNTGSNVAATFNGQVRMVTTNVTFPAGVYSIITPTSGSNTNSPRFCWMAGDWNALLSVPGFDGPCLQTIMTSPTPAGHAGIGYLTLQPGSSVTEVGLDLRNATLVNHLGLADFTSLSLNGSQTITSLQGTSGTKIPVASGSFTNNHLRMSNSTGDEVDSGVTGFSGTCAPTTTITVSNGIITGCS